MNLISEAAGTGLKKNSAQVCLLGVLFPLVFLCFCIRFQAFWKRKCPDICISYCFNSNLGTVKQ